MSLVDCVAIVGSTLVDGVVTVESSTLVDGVVTVRGMSQILDGVATTTIVGSTLVDGVAIPSTSVEPTIATQSTSDIPPTPPTVEIQPEIFDYVILFY
jgi:hypothetical protein